MARLEPGAGCAAPACGTARIFDNREGANRRASHRTSASPSSPTERAESPTALDPTQARNRKDYKRDADPSRRTRDHRAKLDFNLGRAYLQRWNFIAPASMTSSM